MTFFMNIKWGISSEFFSNDQEFALKYVELDLKYVESDLKMLFCLLQTLNLHILNIILHIIDQIQHILDLILHVLDLIQHFLETFSLLFSENKFHIFRKKWEFDKKKCFRSKSNIGLILLGQIPFLSKGLQIKSQCTPTTNKKVLIPEISISICLSIEFATTGRLLRFHSALA